MSCCRQEPQNAGLLGTKPLSKSIFNFFCQAYQTFLWSRRRSAMEALAHPASCHKVRASVDSHFSALVMWWWPRLSKLAPRVWKSSLVCVNHTRQKGSVKTLTCSASCWQTTKQAHYDFWLLKIFIHTSIRTNCVVALAHSHLSPKAWIVCICLTYRSCWWHADATTWPIVCWLLE